jgi:hypothetical protein
MQQKQLLGQVLQKNSAVASGKVSFGRCIRNERFRGPKRSLEQRCPGCKNYIHHSCGRVLFTDEDCYKQGDVLCPSCDSRADPALLCLPVTQYDEDSSEEGGSGDDSYVSDDDQCCCGCGQDASGSHHYSLYGMKCVLESCYHPDQEVGEEDGNLSYCLQCYGKLAHGRDKTYDEDEEEEPLSTTIASGLCCCGCGLDAAQRNHYCIHSGKRVMAWCFHESQELDGDMEARPV